MLVLQESLPANAIDRSKLASQTINLAPPDGFADAMEATAAQHPFVMKFLEMDLMHIVRHRGKIASTINNALRAKELQQEFGSLAAYFWRFEPAPDARPHQINRTSMSGITTSPESIAMSKDLRKRGWSFVGPTTMYAFMQAMGLVNDHIEGCSARERALDARAAFNADLISSTT